MKKRFKLLIICLILLISYAFPGSAYAEPHESTPYVEDNTSQKSKITDEVKIRMEKMNESEELTVYVVLKGINEDEIMNLFAQKNLKQYDTYTKIKEGKLKPNLQEVKSAIKEKRKIVKDYYENNNFKFINKYCEGKNQIFVSKYSSLCIVKANKNIIEKLAQDENVSQIMLFVNEKVQGDLEIANQVTRADYVRDTYGNTGGGVIIGQIEPGVPESTNTDLNWSNVTCNPATPNDPTKPELALHANQVASIMVGQSNGLAPDAKLFSTACPFSTDFYDNIEWLLDNDVDVINMSASINNNGIYDAYTQWVDTLAVTLSVHFVKSAGNSGNLIGSPGMAYNAITVGAFDDHNTVSATGDTMCDFSDYQEASSSNRPEKPNLIAPGYNIEVLPGTEYDGPLERGTSFSTPQVTGTIAQLISYEPALNAKQSAMGAILQASTFTKINSSNYGSIPGGAQISENEGSGKLDSRGARSIPYYANYWSTTILRENFPYTKTDYISASSSKIRVAIFWLKRNSSLSEQVPFTDLDLKVYDPNGNWVASSTTTYSNYEIVEFDPTVSGTYSIKIYRYGTSDSEKEHVGIAIW